MDEAGASGGVPQPPLCACGEPAWTYGGDAPDDSPRYTDPPVCIDHRLWGHREYHEAVEAARRRRRQERIEDAEYRRLRRTEGTEDIRPANAPSFPSGLAAAVQAAGPSPFGLLTAVQAVPLLSPWEQIARQLGADYSAMTGVVVPQHRSGRADPRESPALEQRPAETVAEDPGPTRCMPADEAPQRRAGGGKGYSVGYDGKIVRHADGVVLPWTMTYDGAICDEAGRPLPLGVTYDGEIVFDPSKAIGGQAYERLARARDELIARLTLANAELREQYSAYGPYKVSHQRLADAAGYTRPYLSELARKLGVSLVEFQRLKGPPPRT